MRIILKLSASSFVIKLFLLLKVIKILKFCFKFVLKIKKVINNSSYISSNLCKCIRYAICKRNESNIGLDSFKKTKTDTLIKIATIMLKGELNN